MKTLIINADDMGVSPAINDAVIKLYRKGAITGTSIIAPGEAFREACRVLKENGISRAGAHLTLTGKFRPTVSSGFSSKCLIDNDGYFPKGYFPLAAKLACGKVKKTALREELAAQIEKIKGEGLSVTHLDSHEHVHMLPWVMDIALELCSEFSIPYIRIPLESPFVTKVDFRLKDLIRYKALRFFSTNAKKVLPKFAVCSNTDFLGHFHSGRLNKSILMAMADNIPEGITELAVHPAVNSPEFLREFPWYSNGHVEMEVLMSEDWENKLKTRGITLAAHF